MAAPHIALVGTCDTKLDELVYLKSQIASLLGPDGGKVSLIDVSLQDYNVQSKDIDFGLKKIIEGVLEARQQPDKYRSAFDEFLKKDRSQRVEPMVWYTTDFITKSRKRQFHGIVSAAGSSGSALVAEIMRALPYGFPKLLVSTVASGDTRALIQESDITMMYSVVDIAGLNPLLRDILSTAAGSIVGMARMQHSRRIPAQQPAAQTQLSSEQQQQNHPPIPTRIGITMFGVTTPLITTLRALLPTTFPTRPLELSIFHATGPGGRALERLIAQGALDVVLDLTTTEIADHIVGGVMSAGPARLSAFSQVPLAPSREPSESGTNDQGKRTKTLPLVLSIGAGDMGNFGPPSTIPEKFRNPQIATDASANNPKPARTFHEHNSAVTLMRTPAAECALIGAFISGKVRRVPVEEQKRVQVLLPMKGLSLLSVPGMPFEDEEADGRLREAVERGLEGTGVKVRRWEGGINEEGFAEMVVGAVGEVMGWGR